MKIHQIDLRNGRWLGQTAIVAETAPVPRGWIAAEADPQPGQRWNLGGWHGMPVAVDDSARIERLYQAAMAQQVATCDSNFYGLLTAIGALAQGTGQPVPTKASECIQWLETMWADYHARKANGSTDFDFSGHGRCPHSFLDVRGET
jgi:uncharacterized protein YbdZ (MbtH family)